MKKASNLQFSKPFLFLLMGSWSLCAKQTPASEKFYSGVGWVEYGIIQHSTDTSVNKYAGNSVQSSGAQLSYQAQINSNLLGAVGLGVIESPALVGNPIATGGRAKLRVFPYIAEARFTYSTLTEESGFSLTAGYFSYIYNKNTKNLGLYLLRGPVWPNVLISGFERKEVLPIANIAGTLFKLKSGLLTSNLIINSETEYYPFFDISTAYIGELQIVPGLSFSFGANLFKVLAINNKLTNDTYNEETSRKEKTPDLSNGEGSYDRLFLYVDSSLINNVMVYDTTEIGYSGTKLMTNFEIAFQELLGMSQLGSPEDLKIYGEIGLIGVTNNKAYKKLYGDYINRMPVMLGFNIPTFGFLDVLSLEVEYYKSIFKNDLSRFQANYSNTRSPIPRGNGGYGIQIQKDTILYVKGTRVPFASVDINNPANNKKDDFKWSLYGAKLIQKHFKISFQIANDHFRPGGTSINSTEEVAFNSLKDWYWMTKLAYFF